MAVPWFDVSFDDPFWAPRLRLVRERTLPALYRQCLTSGRIDALRLHWRPGLHPVPHQFWDSDVAKWLEATCYSLAMHPNPKLEQAVNQTVGLLQTAQQPDGYLNSYFTTVDPGGRWTDLRDGHELYCAGHLIEAGVAHAHATGQRTLLDVVCRYADYIGGVFGRGDGQKRGYCGHPEIELALIRLFRATGQARYLRLSQYFVDERGREPYYFDLEAKARTRPRASDSYYRRHGLRNMELRRYNQSHAPVREQREVVGHAVRAMYLYSAMADLAAETNDAALLEACQVLWSHLTSTRLYITGGIGSSERNEGFSADYALPNAGAYAETCAAVGLALWAQRMVRLTSDGRYTDVLERVLYNAVAAALGADGEHFFYANPLASDGHTHRQPWFEVACCPPNIARLLGSLGEYVYSADEEHLAVHLFAQGTADLCVAGQRVQVRQTTEYPWSGRVRVDLDVERPTAFELRVRVPGWSRRATLRVNGQLVRSARRKGYACVERTWQSGDCLHLELPMPVERMYAHPSVVDDAGCVALQRGPIVYCLEQADNPAPLHNLLLPRAAKISPVFGDGVVMLRADGVAVDTAEWSGQLYRAGEPPRWREQRLLAAPYANWGNGPPGEMRVWMREASWPAVE